jgi:PAS domain S-box-containing protein
MKDDEKTREQLVIELTELRSENAALKKSTTESKSADLVAQEATRYAESIVETVRELLLVLDADLKIISANRNFYTTFKVAPGETIGSFIYDIGNKQWDIPKLRELLEDILPKKEAFDDFEVAHNFQDIGHKIMLLNARQIYRKDIDSKIILLAIEDITEHKRLEDLLKKSEQVFRRTYETANDAILLLEKREGNIAHANPATEKMLGYTQEEMIGNKLEDIGVLIDMGDLQKAMQILDKDGIIHYNNVPMKAKSGQNMDADIYLVDKATLLQCNIRDITERKQATDQLEELNRAFVGRELRMIELKKHIAELEKMKS